ncbi:MAG TPA: class II fructose-bisphosphate aldolase [Candidatus Paceibacterota bacterium]|nr:class II fructose-bisphosphate aldolase [Candidatus Paceibacterota bacterium]
MKTLREHVSEAMDRKVAIGHFNISNVEGFWAVVRAARELGQGAGREIPVIIGVSEGERSFIGVDQAKALVETLQREGQAVYLNADHTYSYDKVKEAVDARYDSVIYDGTEASFDDNAAATRKCVEYARSVNPDMLVEGELGFIGKSSKVLSEIPAGVQIGEEFLTKPEEAKRFVDLTGIDMLAPAVGNIHGMLSGGKDPALNIKRIREIAQAVKVPLVLHGGSGNSAEDFTAAIDAGVAVIHVNTEIRVAYRKALMRSLEENRDEVAPYKIMKPAVQAMQAVVTEKLKVFNKIA